MKELTGLGNVEVIGKTDNVSSIKAKSLIRMGRKGNENRGYQ